MSRLSAVFMVTLVCVAVQAQTVKVTPLAEKTGEFCVMDRAFLFEDPTGVRILYDPGTTIAGGTDSRLGDVHAVLITHAHGDHIGGAKMTQNPDAPEALCTGAFATTPATPESNAAQIATAKNSAIVAAPPLNVFLGSKVAALRGGTPTLFCAGIGARNEVTVPLAIPCVAFVGVGGKLTIRLNAASAGVQVASVPAAHPNELLPAFLSDPEKTNLAGNALSAYLGLATGFVVTFSNGLVVYLSGDTGVINDMATIVSGLYGAKLAVLNIADQTMMGPEEAAYAAKTLIKAKSVIVSHASEVATTGGVVNAGTRTARFIDLMRAADQGHNPLLDYAPGGVAGGNVFVPRSGITMQFDAQGRCVANCGK